MTPTHSMFSIDLYVLLSYHRHSFNTYLFLSGKSAFFFMIHLTFFSSLLPPLQPRIVTITVSTVLTVLDMGSTPVFNSVYSLTFESGQRHIWLSAHAAVLCIPYMSETILQLFLTSLLTYFTKNNPL